MKRITVCSILVFCLWQLMQGQEKHFLKLNQNDGLASNYVKAITVGMQGNLWIGTDHGLSVYDGRDFVNYFKSDGLAGDRVWALAADSAGNMYAGCYPSGLSVISSTGEIQSYSISDSRNSIRQLYFDHATGFLIVGIDYGIYLFKDGVFYPIESMKGLESKATVLAIKKVGDDFFISIHGSNEFGLIKMKIDTRKPVHSKITVLTRGSYIGLAETRENIITNSTGHIKYLDRANNVVTDSVRLPAGFLPWSMHTVNDSTILTAGMYISDFVGGLKYFNIHSKTFSPVPHKLPVSSYEVIYYDEKHQITWVGSSDGLIAMPSTPFYAYKAPPNERFLDMFIHDNVHYLLGENNLYTFENNAFQVLISRKEAFDLYRKNKNPNLYPFTSALEPENFKFHYFNLDGNTLYVVTNGGAFSLPGFKTYFPFSSGFFFHLNNKAHYVREYQYLHVFPEKDNYGSSYALKDGKKTISDVNEFLRDGESMFFTTNFKGLLRSDGSKIYQLNDRNSSMDNYVHGMGIGPDSALWVCSRAGRLFRVAIKDSLTISQTYTNQNSLLNGTTCEWLRWINDKLYLGTNKGLNIFRYSSLDDSIHFHGFYSKNDGYGHFPFNNPVCNENGELYVTSVQGITKFQTTDQSVSYANKLSFSNLSDAGSDIIEQENRTLLTRKNNDIQFAFYLKKFPVSDDVLYKYQLNNGDWSNANTVNLQALKPDNYTLTLEAYDLETAKTVRKQIHFKITPPFYTRVWFIVLCIAGMGLLSWFIAKNRIVAVRAKEAQKREQQQQMAGLHIKSLQMQMNPHFLFNSLNSLQSLIIEEHKNQALEKISQLSQVIRTNLNHVGEELILLDDEITFLKQYLLLEKSRLGNNFYYQFLSGHQSQRLLIPPLLLQPLLENAIKHGLRYKEGERKLLIETQEIANRLVVIITDNGIGREKAKEFQSSTHKSMGLTLTKKRLSLLNEKYATNTFYMDIEDIQEDDKAMGTRINVSLGRIVGSEIGR